MTGNELLMMMDQNSSGKINPKELRWSLMAFSAMGIIAEKIEYQPMDETYRPYTDRIFSYPEHYAGFEICERKQTRTVSVQGKLGWDPDLAEGNPKLRQDRASEDDMKRATRKHP